MNSTRKSVNFKQFLVPFGVYLILKLFSIAIVFSTFEQLFSRPVLSYADLSGYVNCQPTTPNILYSYSICLLNITSLGDSLALTLGLFLNTAKDLAFIMIVYCITNQRICMFFVILLSLHPFLALYHPRYVTTVFSSISLLLVFAYDTKSAWLKTGFFPNRVLFASGSILVGLRYANSVVFLLYLIFKNHRNFYFMSFLLISALSLLWFSWTYIYQFVLYSINDQGYSFSFYRISTMVKATNIPGIDYFLATCLYLLTHLIALTGFREAAVLDFLGYFIPLGARGVIQFILFLTFSLFHIFGIVAFCLYFWQNKGIVFCVIMSILISCLFLTHVRYFVHLIPLALLGWSVFFDKIIFVNNAE